MFCDRVVVCSVWVFLGVAVTAQEVAITPRTRVQAVNMPRANLRMDVQMVQIPVTVTDLRGKPLVDLSKTNFRVFEDDVEKPISAFFAADSPLSTGVVFDSSRSMKNRLQDARQSVEQFLRTGSTGDEYFLIRFSDQAKMLAPFTLDTEEIARQLASIEAKGWTALNDSIVLAANQSRKARNHRRALLVISDGGDNNSRYTVGEMISVLREADLRVYAVSIFEKSTLLEKICEETGGRALWVRKLSDLPDMMERLGQEMRSEYIVGYTPEGRQNDGRYHKVRIAVEPPAGMAQVRTSWRHGYFAPEE
jgi:VWFA-related protein